MDLIKANYEKTLLASQLEIEKQTLEDISREIHDNTGYLLSLTKLTLTTIDWNEPQHIQERVERSVGFISKTIDDLQQLSRILRTDFIKDNGLLSTLKTELEKIKSAEFIEIRYNITGSPEFLDAQTELVIFRIVQEAINNCIKHAHASVLQVWLHYEGTFLIIELIDDGIGFDLEEKKSQSKNGSGLQNIVTRANHVNGECLVTSQPGKGTTIKMKIPYEGSRITTQII